MRARRLFVPCACVAAIAVGAALLYRYEFTGIARLFGGRDAIALVRAAPRVEAFLVHDPSRELALATQPAATQSAATQPALVDHLSIVAGPILLDTSEAARVGQDITDPSIYEFDPNRVSTCTFHADAALRFTNDEQTVIAAFCFTCDQVRVYRNGAATGYQTPCHQGRARILRLFKKLFPHDERIQSLPMTNPHWPGQGSADASRG